MPKFPVDAPIRKVIATLERLGFRLVREGSHISMVRENPDGTKTPLTIFNHFTIKRFIFCTILTQSGIFREMFLKIYEG